MILEQPQVSSVHEPRILVDAPLSKKTDLEELPSILQRFIKAYPEVWSAHEKLGIEAAKAGPLSEKEIQLIKLAVTGSQMLETAFKTHVQKAIEGGATRAEIEHAIVQMLPSWDGTDNDGNEVVPRNTRRMTEKRALPEKTSNSVSRGEF